MRAAAIQLNSTADKPRNLETAERLVREATDDGAEPIDGETITACREWACELGIHLLAGSFAERVPEREKLSNTSVLIDPDGEIVATYRKIHMFDVDVGGVEYRESASQEPGTEIVIGDAGGVPVGMTVCYDVRFPELYRILAVRGARVITVPAAFTLHTGKDHWEPLLRARAIENQAFVLAPNQIGEAPPHYNSYGRSMIVDPWGVPLATAPDEECFVAADLDLEAQENIRASLPSLANRRPRAYGWEDVATGAVGA